MSRAVDTATRVAKDHPGPVYTDGPLVHNEELMSDLRARGIQETNAPATLSDGSLIIRAHGIPPSRRDELEHVPLQIVDATCPDVARIQGLIRKHVRAHYHILIFGDPGHPEITGFLGYAEGTGHMITTVSDIDALPDLDRVCLISQSTQLPRSYQVVADAVRVRFPDAVVLDTICEATRERQEDVEHLAQKADMIVVVGGSTSANTHRLAELAATLKPTILVHNATQLKPTDFRNASVVGLTAGASTPAFVIESVRQALEALNV